jgi:aspartate 1-decarboxylase
VDEEELATHQPKVISVDEKNRLWAGGGAE